MDRSWHKQQRMLAHHLKIRQAEAVVSKISFVVACGKRRGNMIYSLFICPGTNERCIEFNGTMLTPWEFCNFDEPSLNRDWMVALMIDGMCLGKMLRDGLINFYKHTNKCRRACGRSPQEMDTAIALSHLIELKKKIVGKDSLKSVKNKEKACSKMSGKKPKIMMLGRFSKATYSSTSAGSFEPSAANNSASSTKPTSHLEAHPPPKAVDLQQMASEVYAITDGEYETKKSKYQYMMESKIDEQLDGWLWPEFINSYASPLPEQPSIRSINNKLQLSGVIDEPYKPDEPLQIIEPQPIESQPSQPVVVESIVQTSLSMMEFHEFFLPQDQQLEESQYSAEDELLGSLPPPSDGQGMSQPFAPERCSYAGGSYVFYPSSYHKPMIIDAGLAAYPPPSYPAYHHYSPAPCPLPQQKQIVPLGQEALKRIVDSRGGPRMIAVGEPPIKRVVLTEPELGPSCLFTKRGRPRRCRREV